MRRLDIASFMLALLLPAASPADQAGAFFSSLDGLPMEERYRQLSLMLMVSDGADQALIGRLTAHLDDRRSDSAGHGGPEFDFDDYTTPLIRIVDQQTMLAGATRLFRFTRDHAGTIAERLKSLQYSQGEAIEPGLEHAIAEDAIIIRNAIADSIDYATLQTAGDEDPLSAAYRARTVYLRNNLEYELFAAELDRITEDAIASVGGKTDAYERMFDDEVDAAALDKKIKAAEYAYGWDREFDERAAKLTEEIINKIWDRESDLDP